MRKLWRLVRDLWRLPNLVDELLAWNALLKIVIESQIADQLLLAHMLDTVQKHTEEHNATKTNSTLAGQL